jgi:hypothetical protein
MVISLPAADVPLPEELEPQAEIARPSTERQDATTTTRCFLAF